MKEEQNAGMTYFKYFRAHFVQNCPSAEMFSDFNPHYPKAIQGIA